MAQEYTHRLQMQVRDYECDQQNVVNNAVYLNYFQHARDILFQELGLSWIEMHKRDNVDMVIRKVEMEFKAPLQSGDIFEVRSRLYLEGRIRLNVDQNIYKDDTLILKGKIYTAAIDATTRRPVLPDYLKKLFAAA